MQNYIYHQVTSILLFLFLWYIGTYLARFFLVGSSSGRYVPWVDLDPSPRILYGCTVRTHGLYVLSVNTWYPNLTTGNNIPDPATTTAK